VRLSVNSLSDLDVALATSDYGEYLYMYPPRQAYRPLPLSEHAIREAINDSTAVRGPLNVYIHIPFCKQLCRFCNLYTTSLRDPTIHDLYIDRLNEELRSYEEAGVLHRGDIPTIYLGGGTPSVLSLSQLERLVEALIASGCRTEGQQEFAIEVAPETVDLAYLIGLKELGFSRVSMGLQSSSADELRIIGRGRQDRRSSEVVSDALDVGFSNVCIDLIFGLPGQTTSSWVASLKEVARLDPPTVCAYAWTPRPGTGFHRQGQTRPAGDALRERFQLACSVLADFGYVRETHVRWSKAGGGYLQKTNHWGLQNLVGLGAGARSYFEQIDLRNGYSLSSRTRALDQYLDSTGFGWAASPEGFRMSEDERRRKAMILNLHALDRDWYRQRFGHDVTLQFGSHLDGLSERGLISVSDRQIELTEAGYQSRDLIVQLFLSDEARSRTLAWVYDE
jgi:oxygen-independent coproporphyrinogen-3 oxidase